MGSKCNAGGEVKGIDINSLAIKTCQFGIEFEPTFSGPFSLSKPLQSVMVSATVIYQSIFKKKLSIPDKTKPLPEEGQIRPTKN